MTFTARRNKRTLHGSPTPRKRTKRQSWTCILLLVAGLALNANGREESPSRLDDEFQGYSHLPYPEDKIAYMQAVMPPMQAGMVSGFLVEITGLVQDVEYILDVEWSQVTCIWCTCACSSALSTHLRSFRTSFSCTWAVLHDRAAVPACRSAPGRTRSRHHVPPNTRRRLTHFYTPRLQDGRLKVHFTEHVTFAIRSAPPETYRLVLESPELGAGIYTLNLNLLDAFPGGGTYQDVLIAQREVKRIFFTEAPGMVLITALGTDSHRLPHAAGVGGARTNASAAHHPHDAFATAEAWDGCAQIEEGIATRMVLHLLRTPAAGFRILHSWSLSPEQKQLKASRDEDLSRTLSFEHTSPVPPVGGTGTNHENEARRQVVDFDSPALAAGVYLLQVLLLDNDERQVAASNVKCKCMHRRGCLRARC